MVETCINDLLMFKEIRSIYLRLYKLQFYDCHVRELKVPHETNFHFEGLRYGQQRAGFAVIMRR